MCRHEGKYWRFSNAAYINYVYQQCSSIGILVPAPMPPLCSLHIHTNPLGTENHLPLLPFPLLPAPNTFLTSTADDPHGYIWVPEYHTNHIIFSLQTETATDSVVGKVLLCPEYQNTENCYLIELGNTVTSIQRFSDFKEIGECRLIRCRFSHKSGSTLVQVMVLSFRCWAIIWNNIANLPVAPSGSYDVTIMQCVFQRPRTPQTSRVMRKVVSFGSDGPMDSSRSAKVTRRATSRLLPVELLRAMNLNSKLPASMVVTQSGNSESSMVREKCLKYVIMKSHGIRFHAIGLLGRIITSEQVLPNSGPFY